MLPRNTNLNIQISVSKKENKVETQEMTADFTEVIPEAAALTDVLCWAAGEDNLSINLEAGFSRQCSQSVWRNAKLSVGLTLGINAVNPMAANVYNAAHKVLEAKLNELMPKVEAYVEERRRQDRAS